MFYSTRSKLIACFIGVVLLVGVFSLYVGNQLLYKSVLSEATTRVRLDLNAAREIYLERINLIRVSLHVTTLGVGFLVDLEKQVIPELVERLTRMAAYAELDFAGIVSPDGKTLCRMGPNRRAGQDSNPANPIAQEAIERGVPVFGTVVLSTEFLFGEDPELADQARVPLLQPSKAKAAEEADTDLTSGMALAAAIPVYMNGEPIGVLYGGVLLNREHKIVDTVRDTVFHNEIYEGRSFGAVSIFFHDVRISSTVLMENERRAIGTRVSREVRDHVLGRGEKWTSPAFVVNDWYLTSYEPIEDIKGNRIGILGLGVLEKKYVDMRRRAVSLFALITVASMAVAMGLGYIATQRTTGPVRRLIKAAQQVSEGSLNPEIGPISKGEMGLLQKTFREMVAAMGRRRTESEIRLVHSEKQASVGRLAAGVAHEINNPLTGVLTYTHMLLRRKDIGDDVRSDLEVIAKSTERVRKIVKGLLDFSRETRLNLEPTEVNDTVQSAISLTDNQALMKGVTMRFIPGENLPMVTLDRSQIQSVLMNVIINALDATEKGGSIHISTCTSLSVQSAQQKGVEIAISDTGCGIPPENLDKLFDPFFTTKQVGQGTGLGLAVSFGIIQRHGGTIRVQSEQGKGSTFVVWLPVEGLNERHENPGRG